MRSLANFVLTVCLLSSPFVSARDLPQIKNPTARRVFVHESKPRTLILIPDSHATPSSEKREYYVSERECLDYNALDQADLNATSGLGSALNGLSVNSTAEQIQAAQTEFNKKIGALEASNRQRIAQSKSVGGKVTVRYDFGIERDVQLIRKANPGWSVEIADFKVDNKQLYFAIPDGVLRTDADFQRLPFILDYRVGNFSADDLYAEGVIPGKQMTIKGGKVTAEFTISKRAACFDMQVATGKEKPKILFSMSLNQDAYYCAFPVSQVDPLIRAELTGKCK